MLGNIGRSGQSPGKTWAPTAPFVHLTRLFQANWIMKGGSPKKIRTTGATAGITTQTGLLVGKVPRGWGVDQVGVGGLCRRGKSGAVLLGASPPAEGLADTRKYAGNVGTSLSLTGAEARQRRNIRWRDLLPLPRAWFLALLVPCAHLMTLNLESSPGRGGTLMRTGVSGALEAVAHLLLPHGQRGGT